MEIISSGFSGMVQTPPSGSHYEDWRILHKAGTVIGDSHSYVRCASQSSLEVTAVRRSVVKQSPESRLTVAMRRCLRQSPFCIRFARSTAAFLSLNTGTDQKLLPRPSFQAFHLQFSSFTNYSSEKSSFVPIPRLSDSFSPFILRLSRGFD